MKTRLWAAALALAPLTGPALAQDIDRLRSVTLQQLFFDGPEAGIGACLWAAFDPDMLVASMMAMDWTRTDHGEGFLGYAKGEVEFILSRDGRQCSVDVQNRGSLELNEMLSEMLEQTGFDRQGRDTVDPLSGCTQRNITQEIAAIVTGPRDTGSCESLGAGGILFLSGARN